MRFSPRKTAITVAAPLALAGAVGTAAAASAGTSPAPPVPPNITVHLVEKSGFGPGSETKAAMAGPFRIFVRVGPYLRWYGNEDFRQVRAIDGSYRLELAPQGRDTGLWLAVAEREQYGRYAEPLWRVPDARLTRFAQMATVFRDGPSGPLGYHLVTVTHREGPLGQRIEVLTLTDDSGKLDLRPAALGPLGFPSVQLWAERIQVNSR